MATFTFDGTSSITATKGDTVLISADVQTFTQATDNGSSVTLAFGANSITITGTTLVAGNLPNVFVIGGTFTYANTTNMNGAGTGNVLSFLSNTAYTLPTTTASSKAAVFGGLGRVDQIDGNDTLHVGGKGNQLVFGNNGVDSIDQVSGAGNTSVAFDSTSVINVFGDKGNDIVNFFDANNSKASIYVGGGDGEDQLFVRNSGTTTIQGGLDSTDGKDTIVFDGNANAAGTSRIFGNGGADSVFVGFNGPIDSTSSTTVYGGFGNDQLVAQGVKATISILGNEGADVIQVVNTGNTFITGGNESGDQSADSADQIFFSGSGNVLIYGNVGDDQIGVTLGSGADTTNISIYGGRDNDTIFQDIAGGSTGKATVFIAGGEGTDTITANGNGGAVTIYGGISNADPTDGADSITYAGSGVANIFGNGGTDTIKINALGAADSTNATVTVSGGGGDDSITVAAQADGKQPLVLTGDAGNDTFAIAKGTGQTITITDFAVSGDKLNLTATGAASTLQVVGGAFQTLQAALDAAASATGGQNKAAAVAFSGSTYVVINGDNNTTFQAATDQAIKLTGVTDLVALAGQTTITA